MLCVTLTWWALTSFLLRCIRGGLGRKFLCKIKGPEHVGIRISVVWVLHFQPPSKSSAWFRPRLSDSISLLLPMDSSLWQLERSTLHPSFSAASSLSPENVFLQSLIQPLNLSDPLQLDFPPGLASQRQSLHIECHRIWWIWSTQRQKTWFRKGGWGKSSWKKKDLFPCLLLLFLLLFLLLPSSSFSSSSSFFSSPVLLLPPSPPPPPPPSPSSFSSSLLLSSSSSSSFFSCSCILAILL